MDAASKFTGKAELYSQHRPSYPDACISYLIEANSLTSASIIADIGSGTGILSKQLLDISMQVTAVEPNEEMRQAAENQLGHYEGYTSVSGTAEHTELKDHSVDLVIAAQAFHWFDPIQFKLECQRILRTDARAALIWNSRIHTSPIVMENAEICRKYCPDFTGFSGGIEQRADSIELFFRDGDYEYIRFENDLMFHLDAFIGRNLSASYALTAGDAGYEQFVSELTDLFNKYSNDGVLLLPNETRCYMGKV